MKLNKLEIKTDNVYLNIINGDTVTTKSTTKTKALEEYGDNKAKIIKEPTEEEKNGITEIEITE